MIKIYNLFILKVKFEYVSVRYLHEEYPIDSYDSGFSEYREKLKIKSISILLKGDEGY